MIKIRRSALAVALSFSITSLTTQAIGLGPVESNTSLNQPLNLSFPLLTDEPELSNLKVSLADFQQHQSRGIEYPRWLAKLDYQIVESENGFMLNLSTRTPVKEPIVDFIIAVKFKGMTLYKEVTLLLDLPQLNASQNFAKVSQAPEKKLAAQPSQPLNNRLSVSASPSTQIAGNQPSENNRVKRGDSLWKLAANWQADNLTQTQKMQSLFEANPGAFIAGDKSRLKEGSLIQYPDQTSVVLTKPVKKLNDTPFVKKTPIVSSSQVNAPAAFNNSATDSKISALQNRISQFNLTIEEQQRENAELRTQLIKLERMLANLEVQTSSVTSAAPATALTQPRANPVNQVTQPTPVVNSSWSNSPSAESASNAAPNFVSDQAAAIESLLSEKQTGGLPLYQLLLLGFVGLLGLSFLTRKLANSWRLSRFNKKLDKKLNRIAFKDSRRFTEVPRVKDLKIPVQSSTKSQIACIKSAADFYLRSNRYDLAKELVNESLVEHASNTSMVKKLLLLRKSIYLQIDSNLQNDIVEKLEHPQTGKSIPKDQLDIILDDEKIALIDDEFGHLWNRRAS